MTGTERTLPAEEKAEREKITRAGQRIAVRMEEIARLLTPQMRITLLMRHTTNANNCAIVSDEDKADVDAACDTLRRLLVNPTGTVDL
jgi:hypothetical protein